MIRSEKALLRHAQDFFRSDLVGLYSWDHVKLGERQLRPAIAPNTPYRERKRIMEEREGKGKYIEQERLAFGPWEILMYSAQERGPLGELVLRRFLDGSVLVTGPLDPATWSQIGKLIRSESFKGRKAS